MGVGGARLPQDCVVAALNMRRRTTNGSSITITGPSLLCVSRSMKPTYGSGPSPTPCTKMSGVRMLFEIHQGMAARGADISWLSMYPNEDEILFPPMTALEVITTRTEGSIIVVEIRPTLAHVALSDDAVGALRASERTAFAGAPKYTRLDSARGSDYSWAAAGVPHMEGHASWVEAYYPAGTKVGVLPPLYEWLLRHSRSDLGPAQGAGGSRKGKGSGGTAAADSEL